MANPILMKLADFQTSQGIAFADQILLVNNPKLSAGYTPCFFPWTQSKLLRFLPECIKHGMLFKKNRHALPWGFRSTDIFAGYYDRSFDNLAKLEAVYQHIEQHSDRKYQLLIGKGDYTFTEQELSRVPRNVQRIFANNVCVEDERLFHLPMGRDFRSAHLFADMRPETDKSITLYCNFSTNTHAIREYCRDVLVNKPFVESDHMGEFRKYSLSREEFFAKLRASHFCVCPRGNAFDTFRMWDCMYVGTIPIVIREAAYQDELTDLPILFLDDYKELESLTEQELLDIYGDMLNRTYNYRKLHLDYWLNPDRRN